MTDPQCRTECVETMVDAIGSIRLTMLAIRGSVDAEAFTRRELRCISRLLDQMNSVAELALTFTAYLNATVPDADEGEEEFCRRI